MYARMIHFRSTLVGLVPQRSVHEMRFGTPEVRSLPSWVPAVVALSNPTHRFEYEWFVSKSAVISFCNSDLFAVGPY